MFDHGGYLRSFDHRGPIYTCGHAWEALHQVSKHRRLVIQRSVVDNEPTYIRQRKQYESRQTGPREHVRMFLEHFFSDDLGHVEIMPFHDGNSETFKKHLPPWMTKICVYYYYKSWAEDDNAILRDLATESEVKLASFDTFRRTWKDDFPDVTTPKTVKPDMLLKYHLTCVKYDGYRPDDIYYYTNTIPHDSSTTCTLTWITIMKVIQHRGRKIPYIRIQMDNTVRENKNRNVAALCNWLVSIGICDVIHLVFLPVGHTHERVDQIFSRISLALSRSSAYTIEAFLDLVAKAFSPTPEIAELSFSLDFSEWLRPHFQDHIQDISKPHKFKFTRDDAAASGGSLRTALWSNTPLSEPVQILKSAPTGTPEIRAGRPLLYALCDKKKPEAVKVQRYLDDFKKVRSYITDLAVQWHFSPVERESWKNLLDDLDEMQTAPSAAFSGFWPQRKEEADHFLREHGQTAPAEARHTMATNADLNNAEAARVEAEVRAQVLQDDNAFRGVHAGAKERLHDNTSPSDAKGSNLVVIDVSDAIHDASGSREVFNEDGTMVRKKCKNEVWDWEDRVAKLAGLEISEDGKRAIIDVMQALRTRLAQFPKDQLSESREIVIQFCGMKLHDEIYTFKMVLGGDMAWQSGIYGHAGAASTFFCFVCDMLKHYMHLTQSDYERKGMSMPMIKSAQYAAMLAHAMGQEYGLTEPYPCPGCGETVHFHGDLPPADTPAARQNYQHAHFGQRHMCPPGFMMIEPEDMICDTMHAGIQICPHVVWHTVHKRCKTKEEAEAIMDAMQLIGLPGREVKVKTGKGKAITKADLPALSGPEVKKMVDGHEVVLDAIISRSDPIRPNLKKEKADKVKKEMAAKASKRKSVMAERADKHKKQNTLKLHALLPLLSAQARSSRSQLALLLRAHCPEGTAL
eukprot:jgi/Tetstr1/457501/TSEL_044082.t1